MIDYTTLHNGCSFATAGIQGTDESSALSRRYWMYNILPGSLGGIPCDVMEYEFVELGKCSVLKYLASVSRAPDPLHWHASLTLLRRNFYILCPPKRPSFKIM